MITMKKKQLCTRWHKNKHILSETKRKRNKLLRLHHHTRLFDRRRRGINYHRWKSSSKAHKHPQQTGIRTKQTIANRTDDI